MEKYTTDKQMTEIKEKLENLAIQLDKAVTEGQLTFDTMTAVLNNLTVEGEDKDKIEAFINSTRENLEKSKQQLAGLILRRNIAAKVLENLRDETKLEEAVLLLMLIGAERPVEEILSEKTTEKQPKADA